MQISIYINAQKMKLGTYLNSYSYYYYLPSLKSPKTDIPFDSVFRILRPGKINKEGKNNTMKKYCQTAKFHF